MTGFGVNFLILEAEVHLGEEVIEVLLGEAEGEELKQLKVPLGEAEGDPEAEVPLGEVEREVPLGEEHCKRKLL